VPAAGLRNADDTPPTTVLGMARRAVRHRRAMSFTQAMAEREREGSAAGLTQQMSARRAARYRKTTAPAQLANAQHAPIPQSKDQPPKNWRDRASSFSFSEEQPHARLCSTVLAKIALFALPAWNETGTRFAPRPASSRGRQARNDSRLRSTSKASARQLLNARSLSCCVQSCTGRACSNIFFWVGNWRNTGRNLGRGNAIRPGWRRSGRDGRCLLEARGH